MDNQMPGVPGGSDPNAPMGGGGMPGATDPNTPAGGMPAVDPNAIGGVQTPPPAPMQTPVEPVNPTPAPVQPEQGTGMGTGMGGDTGANGGQMPPTGGVPA